MFKEGYNTGNRLNVFLARVFGKKEDFYYTGGYKVTIRKWRGTYYYYEKKQEA